MYDLFDDLIRPDEFCSSRLTDMPVYMKSKRFKIYQHRVGYEYHQKKIFTGFGISTTIFTKYVYLFYNDNDPKACRVHGTLRGIHNIEYINLDKERIYRRYKLQPKKIKDLVKQYNIKHYDVIKPSDVKRLWTSKYEEITPNQVQYIQRVDINNDELVLVQYQPTFVRMCLDASSNDIVCVIQADKNELNQYGGQALLACAKHNRIEAIHTLLDHGVYIGSYDDKYQNIFHVATKQVLNSLKGLQVDYMVINAVDRDDKTPKDVQGSLPFEDAKHFFEINDSYMERQLRRHYGKYTIEEICKQGQLKHFQCFVNNDSTYLHAPLQYRRTPLMISILHGHLDLVNYIINKHVDITTQDAIGRNAIDYMLDEYQPQIVECILPCIEKKDIDIKKVIENIENNSEIENKIDVLCSVLCILKSPGQELNETFESTLLF